MQKQQWEIDNNITADRFTDHHEYYIQLASALGIGWNGEEFMGHDKEYWKRLFDEDEHLNNHPLSYFDACYGYHRLAAARCKIPWSLSNTVCCLKAVIINHINLEV